MVKWYSLFSHTGQETLAVRDAVSDVVQLQTAITTNMNYNGALPCLKFPTGKDINAWLMTPGNVSPGSVITLNGYMRIIPEEVLEYLSSINCKVFNIHPAPIWLYPELKGKDPQERLWEGLQNGKYTYIGAVIHKVDSGVDTGDIVYYNLALPMNIYNKDDLYSRLHAMGTEMWLDFFAKEMWR